MKYETIFKSITIEDSIDELNRVVESLIKQRDSERIQIDFSMKDSKKWKKFNAVFPSLPDFIECNISGVKLPSSSRLYSLCFSGGNYSLSDIECIKIFATNNTQLTVLGKLNCVHIFASKNTMIQTGFSKYIRRISAYDNSCIDCSFSEIIMGYDNSTIKADGCHSVTLTDNAKGVINHSPVYVESNNVTLIAKNSDVIFAMGATSANVYSVNSALIFTQDYNFDRIIMDKDTKIIFSYKYSDNDYEGRYTDPRTYLNKDRIYYKCVHKDKEGRYYSYWDNTFTYTIGETVLPEHGLDTEPASECGSGIHVATIEWALDSYYLINKDMAILEVEVPEDAEIVVPYASTGKLRASKVKVLREVPVEEFGIMGEIYKRLKGD